MKLVLASYGSRGDVEPCVAVGCELLRRGHEVHIAVPPDHVGFAEEAGLIAVAYGPDTQVWWSAHRDFWTQVFSTLWKNIWRLHELVSLWRKIGEPVLQYWEQIGTTLRSLADGADLLITFLNFEPPAANVAEYYGIPLATLHVTPVRANGHFLPFLPPSLGRHALKVYEWLAWRGVKKFEDAQRRQLGLPRARGSAPHRITERGSLEVQAYDEAWFPGLASEWARRRAQRPFVGALTMDLPNDSDDEIASWIAAGTPPIYFGFGSTPIKSPNDMLDMISAACAQLGERALVCAGWSDFSTNAHSERLKVVGTMNYSKAFPACRALVHHGGMGTTSAGLRAGIPMLILWTALDQAIYAAQITRLKVGCGRRISATTSDTLVADLHRILNPQFAARSRQMAGLMTKPAESVVVAADLLESFARSSRVR